MLGYIVSFVVGLFLGIALGAWLYEVITLTDMWRES